MKLTSPNQNVPLNRVAIFTPGRQSDAELKAIYIARQALLQMILDDIASTRPGGIPQHHLVVGQRGMGKTTLLRRIAVALRESPLSKNFIPLSFPEEQWTVDRLSTVWLNCLDSLADTLENEGNYQSLIEKIDQSVETLRRDTGPDDVLAQDAERKFLEIAALTKRRPVLLIDNLDLVFERLQKHELNSLRAAVTKGGSPIIIGASVHPPAHTQDYRAPFYDHFKTHYLSRLSLEEMRDVLLRLSQITGNKIIPARIDAERGRLRALHTLTGGNPRTTVILFQIFSRGFSQDAYQDLEALLDWITPLYKARFEELSEQAQVIVSALATIWEPATSTRIGEKTRLLNNQVTSQLDRLKKAGVIEEVTIDPEDRVGPLPDARTPQDRTGYQLAERFFNIWFLMRQATRRDKRNLTFLTRFIECVHTPAERDALARDLLMRHGLSREQRIYGLALESAIPSLSLRYELHDHVENEFIDAKRRLNERIDEIIDPSEIPVHKWEFAELRDRLVTATPSDAKISGEDFAKSILGSPAMITRREAIATSALDDTKVQELLATVKEEETVLKRQHDEEAVLWFQKLLRGGVLADMADIRQISDAFKRATTRAQVKICADFAEKAATQNLGGEAWENVVRLFTPADSSANKWTQWGVYLAFHFGRYQEAESAFKKALEVDSGHGGALTVLGSLYLFHFTRFAEAEKYIRGAISVDPKLQLNWLNLAYLCAMHLGRYAEAEDAYRKMLELDPKDSTAWSLLGSLLEDKLSRYDEAEIAYRRAIEYAPGDFSPLVKLATLLQNRNRVDEAIALISSAGAAADKDYRFPFLLGALLYREQRLDEAEAAYRQAIALDPDSAIVWTELGDLLVLLDRFAEAEEAYRRAVAVEPKSAEAWRSLAGLSAAQHRYSDAENAYKESIACDPNDNETWRGLGLFYETQMHRITDAEKAYRQAVAIDLTDSWSWNYLGDLLRETGRFREAKEAFQKALEGDAEPDSKFFSWNQLGLILGDHLGSLSEAVHALRQAVESDPENSLAPKFNLVSILRDQVGDLSEARRVFAELRSPDEKTLKAGIALQSALFAAYEDNWGLATGHLNEALNLIADQNAFPSDTFPIWMRTSAVLLHLDMGQKLSALLKERGDDQRLRPWYEALRAHLRGDKRYLRNVPVEMQEVASKLYDEIASMLKNLPATTGRWTPPGKIRKTKSSVDRRVLKAQNP